MTRECSSAVVNSPAPRRYMKLFRVESGPRIARVHRIHVPEMYHLFSATRGSDTLVAMFYRYMGQSVRVHRLRGDRLKELASNPIEIAR